MEPTTAQSVMTNEEVNALVRDWPQLNEDSVVFEIGAYKGQWACDIWDKYHCHVYAFEPQEWACEILRDNVAKRHSVYPFNFALGNKSQILDMGEWGTDGCSFVNTGPSAREHGRGMMRDMREFLSKHQIDHIDLVLINIEGYEYDLLRYIITTGIIHNIDALCIQWHTFADPDGTIYHWIVDYLHRFFVRIHDRSQYPTIEVWERNKS